MKLVCGLAAAAALAILPATGGAAQIPLLGPKCFGAEATIVGTDGDDVIEGTPDGDVIAALGGDDTIRGLGGGDAICAGPGADEVVGGPGPDGIAVGRGADVARGGDGHDLVAEFSSDGCGPCMPVDPSSRDVSPDTISGGPGADALGGEGGNDVISGGEGQDLSLFLSRFTSVSIDLSLGRAVSSAGGIDELSGIEHALGSVNSDVIRGDAKRNALIGLWGQDVVDGAGGGDWIYPFFSGSVLTGGEDESQDTLMVTWGEPVFVDLGTGVARMRNDDSLFFQPDAVARFENVLGGSEDDQIIGDVNSNLLEGGAGHDEVSGGAGNDYVFGDYADEADLWLGTLPGNDVLDGGEGRDRLDGGPLVDECINGERYIACEQRDGEQRSYDRRSGEPATLPWWWAELDYDYLHETPAVADLLTSLL